MFRKSEKIIEKTHGVVSPVIYRYTKVVIESGQGSYLFDADGNRYLDFASGICTCPIGHSHPAVVEAINGQSQKILHVCDHVGYYEPYTDYMDDVISILPGELSNGKGIFLNSGSEAVEGALKLARYVTRRPYVLSFVGSFHGRTMGAAAVTGSTITYRKGLSGLFPGVFHVPYPYCYRCPFGHEGPEESEMACLRYIDLVLEKIVAPDDLAAIIFEPISGEGGYVVPPPGFMKGLREICDRTGALLIADEVQSGIGRTGKWFGCEHFGVVPDIIAMAKAIGGGLPLSAVVGKKEIMDKWDPSTHGTTFGGNPISCAAGKATLEILRVEKILENVEKVGNSIQEKFKSSAASLRAIGDVRGKGLMVGVELVGPDREPGTELLSKVLAFAGQNGLIITKCGPNVLRIAPPLNITREQAEMGVDILLTGIERFS
ncbi:MAG: aminotransferase class III-fold pyridoxal phosphate-dependent enzyme [candidate division Zixibacteria bacterium]|nr:aminotransferase class III-fold pyridoxal phosphate-dependent enzyme [candidate division Zixibacteria bacterium]